MGLVLQKNKNSKVFVKKVLMTKVLSTTSSYGVSRGLKSTHPSQSEGFEVLLEPALQGLGAPPGVGIQKSSFYSELLDFVSFFE